MWLEEGLDAQFTIQYGIKPIFCIVGAWVRDTIRGSCVVDDAAWRYDSCAAEPGADNNCDTCFCQLYWQPVAVGVLGELAAQGKRWV